MFRACLKEILVIFAPLIFIVCGITFVIVFVSTAIYSVSAYLDFLGFTP